MVETVLARLWPIRIVDRLLDLGPSETLSALFELLRHLRHWLGRQPAGMYEILEYVSELELVDTKGRTAVLHKQQQVKFLQDHILAFEEYAWGDGDFFARYRCTPGIAADRYQEGDRCNVLISLRETKKRGDIIDFHSERTIKGGFTQHEEWSQVEIRHATRRLRMAVLFPRQRRCRRAIVQQRSRHRSLTLGQEHFTDLPNGRQLLSWETRNVRHFEIYTIRWWW